MAAAASSPIDIGTLIVRTPGTLGERPRIRDTRIGVHSIASLWNQGISAEEIITSYYDYLTLAQVYAALAYYHSNKEAIDRGILEDELQFIDFSLQQLRDKNRDPWLTDEARARAIEDGEHRAAVLRQRLG